MTSKTNHFNVILFHVKQINVNLTQKKRQIIQFETWGRGGHPPEHTPVEKKQKSRNQETGRHKLKLKKGQVGHRND